MVRAKLFKNGGSQAVRLPSDPSRRLGQARNRVARADRLDDTTPMKTSVRTGGARLAASGALLLLCGATALPAERWVVYEGGKGPGAGKHIVLLAGDEEYRSEEGLPMLGKILARRHGFRCTVLFAQDDDTTIDPNHSSNVPGLELLATADLAVMQFRFRQLPDASMKHVVDYLESGKPLLAIRTSTHAFRYPRGSSSPYARWSWDSAAWPGGFGRQVLGDTWVSHHGVHGRESTRGVVEPSSAGHPVLRGVRDVWGPTDVYGIVHLAPTDTVLMRGRTLAGLTPDAPANDAKALMPLVWTRDYRWESGRVTRSLTSTIGAAVDLESAGLRRLFVNACYWLTGLPVPEAADVAYVGPYRPTFFGFDKFRKGVRVSDHRLADEPAGRE